MSRTLPWEDYISRGGCTCRTRRLDPWADRFFGMMKWMSLLLLLLVGIASFWFVRNSRAATESPEYQVVFKDGKIEVREYPELRLATTVTRGSRKNGSFMTLFRFIDGGNSADQKISMTSPVLMEEGADQTTMSFIVPKATAEAGVPEPTSDQVTIRALAADRFVVLRFSRRGTQAADEEAALTALRAWVETQGLTVDGSPLFAYYDPPWTPLFMRRNEVMLRLPPEQELPSRDS